MASTDIPTDDIIEPVSDNVESSTTSEAFETTFREIENFMKDFKGAVSRLRHLKREIISIEKNLKKHEDRRARRKRSVLDENGNKRKNGFSLENNLISDELADFIGYPKGTPISRSEVTRRLTAYVKLHNLQDPEDRRYVNLDTDAGIKLKELLSDVIDKEGNPARLTIITINKFVTKHYVGKIAKVTEVLDTEAKVQSTDDEKTSEKPSEKPSEKMASKKDLPVTMKKKVLKKKSAIVA